jgi:hypothetical protein
MFRIIRNSVVLLCALGLTACLEVKDNNSNDKVVDALTEQNKILQEQANQAAQTKTSVSLTGVVTNLSTAAKATNATVKIKIGSTSSEAIAITAGAFQLDNLPADSDYELVVHSTTNAFVDRVFFGKTRATTSPGKVYQDVGILSVAAGVERKFKIKNAVTNTSITGLTLYANSNVGSASGYEQYLHKSTYDTTTQEYKIVVPERLSLSVYANLDINNDGKAEYRSETNNYQTDLVISDLTNGNVIYLVDLNANAKVKVKVSLVNGLLQPITTASISVNDALNGAVNGKYESATSQYVIDAVIDSSLNVMIPAFSAAGVSYSSSSIQITRLSLDATTYSLSAISSRYYSANFSFAANADKVFDVVVQPSVMNTYSSLSAVAASTLLDSESALFKVFYSGAVTLKADSVSVLKKGVLRVVKGNDSTTDLILPGTTLVETVDVPVAADSVLSLNNTLLTVTPKIALEAGYTYNFSVGTLIDPFLNVDANPYGDSADVVVKSTAAFSINDLKLDNNDYFTNGSLINPTNTAGEATILSPSYWGSSVSLYLPASIENLKTLTLRKEQITKDNVTTNSIGNYDLVINGSVNSYSKNRVVAVAYNENVTGSASYIIKGAAIPMGDWYNQYLYDSLSDNTGSNKNSITFTYAFETKAGVKETGIITLPVL